ncbi:hypothetical protein Pan241w_06410 [Gimesia alba]|uniref:Carboxypeptidase regulatory-like domain-containing protein n=1 Tax=Gimesia alba TaxID=2527973 RepID=A0A517R9M1_9PLAN|nr:carboxypeptidase-like regulatory domain-containing protein [Gimesia alba]QDT40584.1 hypothetical protein Pan241w_06410 [Gimesia alba]
MSFYFSSSQGTRISNSAIEQKHLRALIFPMVCVFFVCIFSGCGGGAETVPSGTASGTVKLDGKPLSQARINFVSSTTGAGVYADLQSDGSYELPNAIPEGDYRVFFTSAGLGDAPPSESGNPEQKDALKDVPKKYQSEQSTDLQALIKEGENTFDFDLKP